MRAGAFVEWFARFCNQGLVWPWGLVLHELHVSDVQYCKACLEEGYRPALGVLGNGVRPEMMSPLVRLAVLGPGKGDWNLRAAIARLVVDHWAIAAQVIGEDRLGIRRIICGPDCDPELSLSEDVEQGIVLFAVEIRRALEARPQRAPESHPVA
jgi:hypothetical protein